MSALQRQPLNMNFLASTGFQFFIERIPHVNFFVQSINLPGKKVQVAEQPTPFMNINLGGNKLKYNDLTVTFKVDEDMQNYLEIFDWINAVTEPEDFKFKQQYLKEQQMPKSIYSDCAFTIMDNQKNPNIRVKIKDAFPISISDIVFSSTSRDEDHVVATAIFKYELLHLEKLIRNVT